MKLFRHPDKELLKELEQLMTVTEAEAEDGKQDTAYRYQIAALRCFHCLIYRSAILLFLSAFLFGYLFLKLLF